MLKTLYQHATLIVSKDSPSPTLPKLLVAFPSKLKFNGFHCYPFTPPPFTLFQPFIFLGNRQVDPK